MVLRVFLARPGQHPAVDPQAGAGSQRAGGRTGVTVDGEGEAVDTGAGDGEDASPCVVAIAEVDEDVLVGDEPVVEERSEAFQSFLIGQSNGEGAAAGCGSRGDQRERVVLGKGLNWGRIRMTFKCR